MNNCRLFETITSGKITEFIRNTTAIPTLLEVGPRPIALLRSGTNPEEAYLTSTGGCGQGYLRKR